MTKIIDCFIFYNELEILYYRLHLLGPLVDHFIIVESRFTFSGKPKSLYYDSYKNKFPYQEKIIHIILDTLPSMSPNINKKMVWKNEYYQRNAIDKGIQQLNLENNDVILVSDVDEIPNPTILQSIKNKDLIINALYSLNQDMYYYNLTCKINQSWTLPKIFDFNSYKNILKSTPQSCRNHQICRNLNNGGWHLSYFGNVEFIQNKLNNFSHQEYNNEKINNQHNIQNAIDNNKDLLQRNNIRIQKIELNDNTNLPPNFFEILNEFN
jgi:beta-1,4-mannosyl-glycoprotein beta-1,4-N-acetylglucosaminyltransferase